MEKNNKALGVNTNSDTSMAEKETDHVTDSKLSDKDQVNGRTDSDSINDSLEDRDTQNSSKDSINGLDKTEVNDSCKDITNTSESSYMTDADKHNEDDTETGRADRKLSNIEKYNMTLNSAEHKEQCRQAGIKSGEARRERKTLGDELKLILSQGDNQKRLCMALFMAAVGGDYKAFNSLRDTIGEMPTQKQEVTTNMTEGDRELLANVHKRLAERNVTK